MQEDSFKNVKNVVKSDLTETTVKTGKCYVSGIVINSNGTSCVFSIKDDTAVKITGTLAASPLPHFCHIGLNIETSLKVEMSGSSAGNVLILYKE